MFGRLSRSCSGSYRPATAFLLAASAAVGLESPAASADPPSYRVQLITPTISTLSPAAMNEAGDVVGTSTVGSGGWVSQGGAPAVFLPLPPGTTHTFPSDINDAGVVVGAAGPTAYPEFGGQAVAWIPDGSGNYTIQQFGTLPGHVTSFATAVNNLGDVIGFSSNGTYRYPVLFSAPGGVQDLSASGIFDPADINDQRVLVDHSFTSKRLDLNTMVVDDLGVPDGPPSYLASTGADINALGQVSGLAIYACCPSCDRVAARYTDGVGWEVFSGCGPSNGASDLNDFGDVVMRVTVGLYVRFEGLGTYRIEDLIVAEVGHWYVYYTHGGTINNARQMAVPATNPDTGVSGVVLLTPVAALAGDLNCDGVVGFGDINPFVLRLSSPTDYATEFPDCPNGNGDVNGDGQVGFGDINPFVLLLSGA